MADDLQFNAAKFLEKAIARVGQSEISRTTGIPQPNISAWLKGDRPMSIERQLAIARACGFEVGSGVNSGVKQYSMTISITRAPSRASP